MAPANADLQTALDTHNSARAAKGVPNLTWSDSLAADAQTWANKLLADGKLSHSTGTGQGENLGFLGFGGTAPSNPAERAVLGWLAEEKDYHGETITADNVKVFGHYSMCPFFVSNFFGDMLLCSGTGQ